MDNVKQAKLALARSTKRGLPLVSAGFLFWIVSGVCGIVLPLTIVQWVYVFGVGVVFPIGLLISFILKIDIFAKGNPLGVLAGIIGGMQILFAPIIIMLVFKEPSWIPFALGVLNGAHFLPYAWIYNSKTYLFHSLATTLVSAIVGAIFIKTTFALTPFAVAFIFLVSLIGLFGESKHDLNCPAKQNGQLTH